jgi:hypothetical protein
MNTYTYNIYRDGELKKEIKGQTTDGEVFAYLHRAQPQSVHYALTHGGWKVKIINEQTGEVTDY